MQCIVQILYIHRCRMCNGKWKSEQKLRGVAAVWHLYRRPACSGPWGLAVLRRRPPVSWTDARIRWRACSARAAAVWLSGCGSWRRPACRARRPGWGPGAEGRAAAPEGPPATLSNCRTAGLKHTYKYSYGTRTFHKIRIHWANLKVIKSKIRCLLNRFSARALKN